MNDTRLSEAERFAVTVLIETELNHPHHTHPDDRSARPHLKTALVKLKQPSQPEPAVQAIRRKVTR